MKKLLLTFLFVQFILVLKSQNPLITKYDTVNADTVINKFMYKTFWQHINRSASHAGYTSFNDGNVIMVWSIYGGHSPDSLIFYVGQQLDNSGKKVGKVFFLDSVRWNGTMKWPYQPCVTKIDENSFVYTFQTLDKLDTADKWGHLHQWYRKYSRNGKPIAPAIRFDENASSQYSPYIIMGKNKKMLIAWKENIKAINWYKICFTLVDSLNKIIIPKTVVDSCMHYDVSFENDIIGFTWQRIFIGDTIDKVFFRLFNEDGMPIALPTAVDKKQSKIYQLLPEIIIGEKNVFVFWKTNLCEEISLKIKDSCSLFIAKFDFKQKKLEEELLLDLPRTNYIDNIEATSSGNKLLLTFYSSIVKNDTSACSVKCVLTNSSNIKKSSSFDLVYARSRQFIGWTFEFPDAEFISNGKIFITWYGYGGYNRIPGNVYYAIATIDH